MLKINTFRNQNSNFSEDPNYEVLLLEHIKRYNENRLA